MLTGFACIIRLTLSGVAWSCSMIAAHLLVRKVRLPTLKWQVLLVAHPLKCNVLQLSIQPCCVNLLVSGAEPAIQDECTERTPRLQVRRAVLTCLSTAFQRDPVRASLAHSSVLDPLTLKAQLPPSQAVMTGYLEVLALHARLCALSSSV